MGACWHNLVNTIEMSVCGGHWALCSITLTTCFICVVLYMGMVILFCLWYVHTHCTQMCILFSVIYVCDSKVHPFLLEMVKISPGLTAMIQIVEN